jgi:hypothetical protein
MYHHSIVCNVDYSEEGRKRWPVRIEQGGELYGANNWGATTATTGYSRLGAGSRGGKAAMSKQ